jgi:hypothetical protein
VTVEIETILVNEELAALVEAAEAGGQLRRIEFAELLEPMELDRSRSKVYPSPTGGRSSSSLSLRRRTLPRRRRL